MTIEDKIEKAIDLLSKTPSLIILDMKSYSILISECMTSHKLDILNGISREGKYKGTLLALLMPIIKKETIMVF